MDELAPGVVERPASVAACTRRRSVGEGVLDQFRALGLGQAGQRGEQLDFRDAVIKRQDQRLLGKIGADPVRERIAPRFEEMRGGHMGRRRGAGLVDVQAEADDLLDLAEQLVEAEFGRRVEGRIAAENDERLDRALADLLGEIADGRGRDVRHEAIVIR